MNIQIPKSLTVIAWIMVALGGFAMLMMPVSLKFTDENLLREMEIDRNTMIATGLIGNLITLLSGIGIFKRWGWSRLVYVTGSLVLMLVTIKLYGFKPIQIFSFIILGLYIYFLFRKEATEFFAGTWQPPVKETQAGAAENAAQNSAPKPSTGRRAVAVILSVIGSFFAVSLGMVSVPLMKHGSEGAVKGVAFYLFLTLLFIVPSIFIWGKNRAKVFIGTVLASCGGFLLLFSMLLPLVMNTPEFQKVISRQADSALNEMLASSIVSGLLFGGIAAILIYLQKKEDKK